LSGNQISVPGFQNPIGHITDEQQFTYSILVSERVPYSFDSMGRELFEVQMPAASAMAKYTFRWGRFQNPDEATSYE
jgi:hypothetical protein